MEDSHDYLYLSNEDGYIIMSVYDYCPGFCSSGFASSVVLSVLSKPQSLARSLLCVPSIL